LLDVAVTDGDADNDTATAVTANNAEITIANILTQSLSSEEKQRRRELRAARAQRAIG